jgi:glycosyltransferase involved in cell wall biosynthesis
MLILPEFPPAIGGMQTHAVYLTQHLQRQGHQVCVYTYQGATPFKMEAALQFDADLTFPIHRVMSRIGYWHSVGLLVEAAREFRPDLIYSSTTFYGLLDKLCGVPVICRSVGNDVMRPWIAYPFRFASKMLSSWRLEESLYDIFRKLETPELVETIFRERRVELMRLAARSATRILANSQFTKELLEEEAGCQSDRVQILVGGVETDRFWNVRQNGCQAIRDRLGIPRDRFLLSTICRLVDKKGVDFLIPAFASFHPHRRNWHLMVCGTGRRGQRYEQLARALGIADRVTFTGPVPHTDIHNYFGITDVFVLASRVHRHADTGLRDAETMGRVLCEANAAGVPVVAANSGGIPSVVTHGENGLLFHVDDAEDLLRQLLHIQDHPEHVKEMRRTGRHLARTRFDWSVVLERHEKAFLEALDQRSSSGNGNGRRHRHRPSSGNGNGTGHTRSRSLIETLTRPFS